MRIPKREAGGLSGALLAHTALCLWLMRPGLPLSSLAPVEEATPVDVELETPPSPPEPVPAPAPAPNEASPAAAPLARARDAALSPAMAGRMTEVEPPPAPAGSSEQPFTFSPVAPSLANEPLGMGGRNPFLGALPDTGGTGPPASSSPAPPDNVAPGIQKSLHDALAAHDHELGMDVGGPLVAIAEEVTNPSDTPENSRAVLEVTVDANGDVTGVRVVDASKGRQAWDRVASSMGATLRSRRIPFRNQGKGLIVTLEVRSRFTLPSGSTGGIDPKLNDDGTAGAHVGFDLSDVGQRPRRNVHARILAERTP